MWYNGNRTIEQKAMEVRQPFHPRGEPPEEADGSCSREQRAIFAFMEVMPEMALEEALSQGECALCWLAHRNLIRRTETLLREHLADPEWRASLPEEMPDER